MPSSSLFQRSRATLFGLALFSSSSFAAPSPPQQPQQYNIDTTYSGTTFFDAFNFWSAPDPTNGFVDYVDENTARGLNLITAGFSSAKIKVDTTTKLKAPIQKSDYWQKDGVGRKSVRIESQKQWTYGLFIADIAHSKFFKGGFLRFLRDRRLHTPAQHAT